MKLIVLIWVLGSCFSLSAKAKLIVHPYKVIKSYWGDQSKISSKTILFTKEDLKLIKEKYKFELTESLYRSYLVRNKNKKLLGQAILFSDTVRTKKMTLLLLLSPKGELQTVEVISFAEPKEYKPSASWLNKQFKEQPISHFTLHKNSANISGATLSAHSVYKAAKTVAVIWSYLKDKK